VLESVIAFIVTSIAIELTPGPNMAYLAVLSLDRGRSAGMAAVAGVAAGLLALGVAAGLGVGVVISETRWLYEVLRWGGVLFLLWLAYDTWKDSRRPIEIGEEPTQLLVHFRRGLITNLLNPKAAMFYIAVLPNYVDPTHAIARQSLVFTFLYVAVATSIHFVVVLAADGLKPLVMAPKLRAGLGVVFAFLLVGIAVWLAVSTRRTWG